MRKSLFLLFVLVFALKLQPSVVVAANFPDIPETHPHAVAIQVLKDAGLVNGYGDGTFKPDQIVSRAESLAMILKAAGIASVKTAKKMPFADVAETEWYYPMVQKGVELGKLKGYEDKTFRPGNPITLPESLALTLSFFQVSTKKITVDPVIYEGLDRTDWYAKYAQYAKDKNLIEPNADGLVDAKGPLTRGQIAQIMYRMRLVQQTGKPFDITNGWIETEHLDNFWKIRHPADWEIFKGQKNSVIWKRDTAAGQAFFTRLWPASARISISLVDNAENASAANYFANLKNAYTKNYVGAKPAFFDLNLGGRPALKIQIPEKHILDIALQLPNRSFLIMYGEYGEAAIGEFYKKKLELVISSYLYVERPPAPPPPPPIPLENRMETLRENILIADKWKDVAPLFPDKRLIHTDAIGVGTGPVDYYYSKEANHTIKLERGTGTILNIKEGETNGF